MYFRWAINALFVGLPYLQLLLWVNLWNLWFNIHLNHWWAHGNVYLMVNAALTLMQSFNSVFLVFEIPVYLKYTKPLRALSLEFAIFYNIFYFIMIRKYLTDVKELKSYSDQASGFEVFENMFYLYNLVLHGPTCVVNIWIIIKEL